MLQCSTRVNKDSVTRKNICGVEHIIVLSSTLPDDIVMNGDLYPADEIAKSFKSLERTLAPVEHPTDSEGNYISASDPDAIHNFYAGAYNTNVTRKDGRVHIEKTINVLEAMKTDRGKRLLDRINELETSENPRAIHTSVGVYVNVESLDEPKTNSEGLKYSGIARDMVFDHDAILLDSVGAAKPSQGVGMAVNEDGNKIELSVFSNKNNLEQFSIERLPQFLTNEEGDTISFSEILEGLESALLARYKDFNNPPYVYILTDSVTLTNFVYSEDDVLFKSSYSVDENGTISIQDDREEVKRSVEYKPVNQPTEDSTMRETILAKLKEMGIIIANSEISDSELLAKYNDALNAGTGDDGAQDADQLQVNKDLLKANEDMAEELKKLKDQLQANKDAEIDAQIKQIKACAKYSAIPESALKHMAINESVEFAKMHAESKPSFGINSQADFSVNQGDDADDSMFAVNGGQKDGSK